MKQRVLMYKKPAKELKVGDSILTKRMSLAEVVSVEPVDRMIHVAANGITGIGMCFGENEIILVVE